MFFLIANSFGHLQQTISWPAASYWRRISVHKNRKQ